VTYSAPSKVLWAVQAPRNRLQRARIDLLAQYVVKDAFGLEARIMEKERANLGAAASFRCAFPHMHARPSFSLCVFVGMWVYRTESSFGFLFDLDSPEGRYYRWRVYSLAMGDDVESYRTEPFQMTPHGPWWIPPEIPRERSASRSRSSSRSPSIERGKGLSSRHVAELQDILKNITLRRQDVRVFVLVPLDWLVSVGHVPSRSKKVWGLPWTTRIMRTRSPLRYPLAFRKLSHPHLLR
jgi:hypothetical protein